MTNGLRLLLDIICHGVATGGIEAPHRLLQPHFRGMKIRTRLREVRMPEHFLHMMDRPAGLEPTTAGFMSKVVEVEIDLTQSFTRRGREFAGEPGGGVTVRPQDRSHPGLLDAFVRRMPSAPKTYAVGG
jgi:hypothetical protein